MGAFLRGQRRPAKTKTAGRRLEMARSGNVEIQIQAINPLFFSIYANFPPIK
jgi:hypothetical protein